MSPAGRFVRVLLFTLGAGAAGCGGDGNGDGFPSVDGGVPLAPEDKAFITDFCAAVMPCCTTNGVAYNATVCKQSMAKSPWTRDPQVRSACLDELRQRAASRACVPDFGDFGDACARVFNEPSGPRAPGETCASVAECMGSPGTVTECFATCITYALGAAGDYPCIGTVFSNGIIISAPWTPGSTAPESHAFLCEKRAGLNCDSVDSTCKPLMPGGSACTDADKCASRVCGGATPGQCAPVTAAGQACNGVCGGDTYCDAGGVCAPKLAAGAACTESEECSGDCKGADLCTGSCLIGGVCSPLTFAQASVLGVWCGAVP